MKPSSKYSPDSEHPLFEAGRRAQPASLFAIFSMLGIAVLFLTIIVLFVLSHPHRFLQFARFPWMFYVSTPVILACSYTIEKTKTAFRRDDAEKLLRYQVWTLAFSILFCVLQYFGWQQLWSAGIMMTSVRAWDTLWTSSSGAYLYVLSGLHVVHLLGGLCFLFSTMFRLVNNRDDMVKSVVYFSDKREGGRISALALYWHFLGALWCVLFLLFLWYFR